MAKYEVIKYFTDLQDNSHPYNVGDIFPRQGKAVTEARIAELSGSNNKQHTPLIKEVAESVAPDQVAPQPIQDEATTIPELPQTESEAGKKYRKADLEGMKVPQIRELAKTLGFKISSMSKEDIIAEFLENQP